MPRRPLSEAEWRRSLQRRRMLDAERKRRLREDSAYRVLERARNREARRRQRENPKFREAERARAHAYYMSLSSTATDEGIICGSCGEILKHVKALRMHRAEFHPRQRMSLDNIFKTPARDTPVPSDGSATDFSKLVTEALKKEDAECNAVEETPSITEPGDTVGNANKCIEKITDTAEHSLVDFYGIIFSDIEATVDRMLSLKLNKQRSYDLQTHLAIETKLKELREYVYEAEKAVHELATNGAGPSIVAGTEEQKISMPSDLISVLREFIFNGVAHANANLFVENGGDRQRANEVNVVEESSLQIGSADMIVCADDGDQCIQGGTCC